jgi:dTDP-4-dehydrorhamnose 3,5-epimerase
MLIKEPKLFKGDIFVDDRGIVGFNNELDLTGVKRFYTITNHTPGYIRAWHGHLRENKYFTMLAGSAIVVAVLISEDQNEYKLNWDIYYRETISANLPTAFFIPAGYANGSMLLEPNSKLMVLSTSTTEESKNDDIRFSFDAADNPFRVKIR